MILIRNIDFFKSRDWEISKSYSADEHTLLEQPSNVQGANDLTHITSIYFSCLVVARKCVHRCFFSNGLTNSC